MFTFLQRMITWLTLFFKKVAFQNSIIEKERLKVFSPKSKSYFIEISIDECLIFPFDSCISENLNEKLVATCLFSLLRIHQAFFSNLKFNSNDKILLISDNRLDTILLSNLLITIGYKVYVHNNDISENDLIIVNSSEFSAGGIGLNYNYKENQGTEVKLLNLNGSENNKKEFFDIIFDFTNEFYKNKIDYLELCSYNCRIIFIDNLLRNHQIDPQDIEYMFEKNMTITFSNSKNYFKLNQSIGKTLNFFGEISEKICKSYSLDKIVKNVNCKKYSINELLNSKKDFNDFLGENNIVFNLVEFNF